MTQLQEIAQYCAEHIEDFDLKAELAYRAIGRHEPIDRHFAQQIEYYAAEWCDEHEIAYDEWDDDSRIDAEQIILNS